MPWTPKLKELVSVRFSCQRKCGGRSSMYLPFEAIISANKRVNQLINIKNRLCCLHDNSPQFIILYKKLESCQFEVVCTKCGTKYMEEMTL